MSVPARTAGPARYRRRAPFAVLAMLAALLSVACSGTADTGPEFTLVAGHQLAGDTPFDEGLQRFAELTEEKTGGRVVVQTHSSAAVGSEPEMFMGMQAGTIDAAVVAPGSIAEFVPEMNLLSMPFLISSRAQRDAVIAGPARRLEALVHERTGVRTMGYFGGGIRNMFFTAPAGDADAIAGRLFRIQPSSILADSFAALGLAPTVVAYNELYSGLQQGVVDGADNESVFVVSQRFYEPAPNLLLTEHEVTIRPLMISSVTLDRLPDDLAAAVLDAGAQAAADERELEAEAEDAALAELREEHGMEIQEVDTAPMVDAVRPVWERYADAWGMRDLLDEIIAAGETEGER